ncbi:MAG: chemotaxis protein CheD [Bacteroidetes bacterium]|jgi:chemotaxis protein CheD|nr:chemotaxis protein CheD [Bacteroidota bacterium]MBT6686194.1 chemotaxis protein CheD [Bacteroidota bacterium]MBT7143905.1 chemotaxis protein CheD [Bacteroidota bacterium]MBT7491260.1 chemotaxis protein CheD [Bacteroidota bacterium]
MIEEKIIYALTGEVKIGTIDEILKSSAIGSCVIIAAYDPKCQIAGMAHVMLAGKSPDNTKLPKTRYAVDAIDTLIELLHEHGSNTENLEICLVGGANVLRRKNDKIAQNNINNIIDILEKRKLKITAKSVGGYERRTATLIVEKAELYYSIGSLHEKLLYKFN